MYHYIIITERMILWREREITAGDENFDVFSIIIQKCYEENVTLPPQNILIKLLEPATRKFNQQLSHPGFKQQNIRFQSCWLSCGFVPNPQL